jgi:hypothetical protein
MLEVHTQTFYFWVYTVLLDFTLFPVTIEWIANWISYKLPGYGPEYIPGSTTKKRSELLDFVRFSSLQQKIWTTYPESNQVMIFVSEYKTSYFSSLELALLWISDHLTVPFSYHPL